MAGADPRPRHLAAADHDGGRRPPTGREAIDGGLALFGGVLFLVPGFITDIVGASLLIGPAGGWPAG